MSGYSHPGWPNVLDNSFWTDKAEELRALLVLLENRQAAFHGEPQLLAYLLNRHSLYDPANSGERRELLSVMPTYSLRPVITVVSASLSSAPSAESSSADSEIDSLISESI